MSLRPPHRIQPERAILTRALQREVVSEASGANAADIGAAVGLALSMTARKLRFSLRHTTSYRFDTSERPAHCGEYAQLYVSVLQRVLSVSGLRASVLAIRSDARAAGRALPWRQWRDHDWVLVVESGTARRWFVDPSLHDMGLGWDVADNVSGKDLLPGASLPG
jgi:hypothetical protein